MKDSRLVGGLEYVVYLPNKPPVSMVFTGETSAATYRSRTNEILKIQFYEMRDRSGSTHILPGWVLATMVH